MLFLLYVNDFPGDVICSVAIDADDTTLYFRCGPTFGVWQQLELTSELESDLEDTLGLSRKRFVDSNMVETQLFPFNHSDNCSATNLKMKGYEKFMKNHLLRC